MKNNRTWLDKMTGFYWQVKSVSRKKFENKTVTSVLRSLVESQLASFLGKNVGKFGLAKARCFWHLKCYITNYYQSKLIYNKNVFFLFYLPFLWVFLFLVPEPQDLFWPHPDRPLVAEVWLSVGHSSLWHRTTPLFELYSRIENHLF